MIACRGRQIALLNRDQRFDIPLPAAQGSQNNTGSPDSGDQAVSVRGKMSVRERSRPCWKR